MQGGSLGLLQAAAVGVQAADPQRPLGDAHVPGPTQAPLNQPGQGFRTSDLTFLEVTVLVQRKSESRSSTCKVGSESWGQREPGGALASRTPIGLSLS